MAKGRKEGLIREGRKEGRLRPKKFFPNIKYLLGGFLRGTSHSLGIKETSLLIINYGPFLGLIWGYYLFPFLRFFHFFQHFGGLKGRYLGWEVCIGGVSIRERKHFQGQGKRAKNFLIFGLTLLGIR